MAPQLIHPLKRAVLAPLPLSQTFSDKETLLGSIHNFNMTKIRKSKTVAHYQQLSYYLFNNNSLLIFDNYFCLTYLFCI